MPVLWHATVLWHVVSKLAVAEAPILAPTPTEVEDTSFLLPRGTEAKPTTATWLRFFASPKGLVLLSTIAFPAISLGVLASRGGASSPVPSSPSQVSVTLGGDANRDVSVAWAAARGSAPGALRWGLSPGSLPYAAPATCTSYATTYDETDYAAYASPLLCVAALSAPASPSGAAVYYAVDGDAAGVRATSTAPPAGAAGVRLAVMGDVGTTADSAATLARIRASHIAAPFAAALLVGDLSYADGNQSVWDDWGALSSPLHSSLPLFTLVGNHEWFDTVA